MTSIVEAGAGAEEHQGNRRSLAARLAWVVLVLAVAAGGQYLWKNWDRLTVWPQKREAMVAALRDPSSVQFREERLRQGQYLCGQINAKNGMGGYTGFVRYAAFEGGYVLEGQPVTTWPRDLREANQKLQLLEAEANWRRTTSQALNKSFDEQPFVHKRFEAVWEAACG